MKFILYIVVFVISSQSIAAENPKQILLDNKYVHCVKPAAKALRDKTQSVWCGIESGSSHPSIWFEATGDDYLSFMPWLSEGQAIGGMSVSDSGKYLAIVHVGEGHPYLLIYDIKKAAQAEDSMIVYAFNPYPGYVELKGWSQDDVIIETDNPSGKLVEDNGLLKDALSYKVELPKGKLNRFSK